MQTIKFKNKKSNFYINNLNIEINAKIQRLKNLKIKYKIKKQSWFLTFK